MKKVLFLLAVVLMSDATDANAQGFLKKLKQKAQAAVSSIKGTDNEDSEEQQDADSDINHHVGRHHHSKYGIHSSCPDEGAAGSAICREDGTQLDGGA